MELIGGCLIVLVKWMTMSPASGSSDIYLSPETNLTWTHANSTCTLAQPKVSYTETEELLDITNTTIPEESEPWVGFLEAFTVFDYQGCWEKTQLNGSTERSLKTRGLVGVCYSACLTERFAINGAGDCTCLNGSDVSTAVRGSYCNRECDGISCGSNDGKYLSAYRLGPLQPHSGSKSMCGTFSPGNTTEWRLCTNTTGIAGFICEYHRKKTTYGVRNGNTSWFELVKECPNNGNCNYDGLQNFMSSRGSDEVYWTINVTARAIHEASMEVNMSQVPVKYGYVKEADGGKRKLAFRENTSSSGALCKSEPTTTSVPITYEKSTTSAPTTTSVPTTPEESTPSSSMIPSVSTTHEKSTTSDQSVTLRSSLDTGSTDNTEDLYIGVGAGLALLAASAVIILLIFYKRRKRFDAVPLKRSEQNFVNADYDNGSPPHSIGESADITAPVLHEYSIIDSTDFVNTKTLPEGASVNVYEECGTDSPRQGPSTEHLYNVAGSDKNLYEDTINAGMIERDKRTTVPTDNVYDVSGSGARTAHHMQSNNIYNTFRNDDSDENEYDLKGASGQSFETDNVYNTASGTQSERNVYDVTDASGQWIQADNVYSIANNV